MTDVFLLFLIIFVSAVVVSATGFGFALIGMPLLSWLLGVQVAAPLLAMISVSLNILVLFRYRASFNRGAISWLLFGSIFGIPIGIWAFSNVSETIILRLLGLVLVGYVTYVFFLPQLPTISQARSWACGFGFIAGCLGGAYNAFGPPIILYANFRNWTREEFKSNLQGFFFLNGIVVIVAHAFNGNLVDVVWYSYVFALPAGFLGVFIGLSSDRFISPELFKKMVLFMLLIIGVALLI